MANNILVQWQNVSNAIANIQAQLNALTASVLPPLSAAVAGDLVVVNAAGNGYVLVPLSGDVTTGTTAGVVTVTKVQGQAVAPTGPNIPASGQIWIWSGTQWAPTTINGDGSITNTGLLTLSKWGGVVPTFTAGAGVTITGTFPTLTIAAGASSAFSSLSTITLGAPNNATQTASIQLKDSTGANINAAQKLQVYMCTDANGAIPSVLGVQVGVTVTVGNTLKVQTAKLYFDLVSNTSGVVTLSFDNTGAAGQYTDRVALVLPTGQLVVSNPLAVSSTAYTTQGPALPHALIWRTPWTVPGMWTEKKAA